MQELRIRFSKQNIRKEADLIRWLASEEVSKIIEKKSDFDVVRMGLIHLARSGHLLRELGIHFPRRADKLPKI